MAVVVGVFACVSSRETFAAGTAPFTWSKYTALDGKEYNYPRWDDAGGGKRWLSSAMGSLTFAKTPPVTKVIFKIYRHAPQGGWNATEVIKYTLNPNPTYVALIGWTLVGKDNHPLENPPQLKIAFDEGEEIKIAWEITTTENGVDTISVVESIITVQYHA